MLPSRTFLLLIFVICGGCTALYLAFFSYYKAEELQAAKGRLALYKSTLESEIERISYFPYVLSKDAHVIAGTLRKDRHSLNLRLKDFAERSQLDAIYLMDVTGLTLASSNYDQENSYVGSNYSFRPYYQQAMQGQMGEFYGIGVTTSLPGLFISAPVYAPNGTIAGVIAMKLNLGRLEEAWMKAGESVLLSNEDGIVLLSSNPDWRYKVLFDLSAERRSEIKAMRQFDKTPLVKLNWSNTNEYQATVNNVPYLLVTQDMPTRNWTLYFFANERSIQVRTWSMLITLIVIISLLFAAWQFKKTRRIGAALRESQADSADLREANRLLAIEIEDRKHAERRLQRTQDELARTSRLAALGQLSVSVTHELGQPIAAMKNYLTAAEISQQPPKVTLISQMSGLVARMENITRQLRFFSRPGSKEFEAVNLQDVLKGSEELLIPNLTAGRIQYGFHLPDHPVIVRGNKLRLEQVLTNLMRNAVDAMLDEEERLLQVTISHTKTHGIVRITDTGSGIGQSTIRDLEEPFYTTRASGEGMGLGLAISTEIVKEHGGMIHAENREPKGAIFIIEIPLEEETENA
ncbi:sensor histidine kinase [Terasakiella pusilla]|uniref:sensor histidine kinase n=1 Tax=Terasakiella pusilla TaxID=64973 RepID=UPI000ACFFB53|nr:ATP-binding protein [Terasakiella pusilla]